MKKKAPIDAKKLAAGLSAVFVSLTLLAGVLAFVFLDNPYAEHADKPVSLTSSGQSSSDASSSDMDEPPASSTEDGDQSEPASSSEPASISEPASTSESSSISEPASSSEPESKPVAEQVFFNLPDEMRAVEIVPGEDYSLPGLDSATGVQVTPNTVAAQIDKALEAAKTLTMNTVLIDTQRGETLLYNLGGQKMEMDCTEYLTNRAREEGFYVYAIYSAANLQNPVDGKPLRVSSLHGDTLDAVIDAAAAFAGKYKLDGILLDDYYALSGGASYAAYLENGGGEGYENYLRELPRALLVHTAGSIRETTPGTQVGLLAAGVWENKSANEAGSDTTAAFTALGNGNTDTRKLVLDGLFDFVMVENFGSTTNQESNFETVAAWWQAIAKEAGKPLYIMHAANKAGTQEVGWSASEQLTTQIISLEKLGGVSGYAFNSLTALSKNAGNAAVMLVKYLNDQINEDYVLTQLALSKPAQLVFTTKEQTVTFQGASDPQEKVTINGEPIPTNESGYFTIKEDLKPGPNVYKIEHKDKIYTYQITREVEVLKSVTPTGNLTVEGGMTVTVSALAYEGAEVSASIGGQTISLTPTEDLEDEELRSTGYVLYMGEFTAPSASSSVTQLGNITVTATAQGITKSLQGASVSVNKITAMGDGAVVQVISDQAETFPISSLDDKSDSSYFPLPQGTLDMSYGNEIVYNKGKESFQYWKLQSGVRVYSKDIKAVGAQLPDNNKITAMKAKSSAQYTTVTLETQQKVPFKVMYDGSKIVFSFQYTSSAPETAKLGSNALFSAAQWNGTDLTLALKKSGGFLGYKAYYDGDSLVLRFNNSPGSLKGARIVIDPGHCTSSPGAPGFYPGKDETDINAAIGDKVISELKSRGATVLRTTPNGSDLETRVAQSRAFNPQAFISIHCNSSDTNSSAAGTEVYYFNPYSQSLASAISANVATALNTANRGGKWGLYYVTRESQYAAVLVETGFVSNEKEYTKLINSKYQNRIAEAIAGGINSYLGGTNSGGSFKDDPDDEEAESENEDDSSISVGNTLTISKKTLNLQQDGTATLTVKRSGKTVKVDWESEDTTVAKVSSSGKVTAVGPGTAYIYAVSRDGSGETKCEVTVEGDAETKSTESGTPEDGVRVKSVTIEGSKTIKVGGREEYTGYVTPSNAQDQGIEWVSSDEDVMVVTNYDDFSCKVEGVAAGTAKLVGYAYDNKDIYKEFSIKVK